MISVGLQLDFGKWRDQIKARGALNLILHGTVVRPPPGGWRVFDHQHRRHLALGRLALPSRFSGEGAVDLGACVAILDVCTELPIYQLPKNRSTEPLRSSHSLTQSVSSPSLSLSARLAARPESGQDLGAHITELCLELGGVSKVGCEPTCRRCV